MQIKFYQNVCQYSHWSLKPQDDEQDIRRTDQRPTNQPVGGSKEQLKERLTKCLEEEGLDPTAEVFEVEDARSTMDPLAQVLEKLAKVAIKVEQQHEHLDTISTKADQQQEQLATISAKATSNRSDWLT